MTKTIVFTAAISALMFTSVAAAQPGPRGHGEREHGRGAMALMVLGAADYNGDNTVTRAELQRLQGEEFAFRDRNGDGYLDQADASPTRQRVAALRPDGAQRGRGARADADGDGRISRAEFLNRDHRLFERLDADDDDAVTATEIDAALEARNERRGARREAARWWRD